MSLSLALWSSLTGVRCNTCAHISGAAFQNALIPVKGPNVGFISAGRPAQSYALEAPYIAYRVRVQVAEGGEVVLRLGVSYPGNPGRLLQEWLVLGSQRLTELRDALYCRTDCDMAALDMQRPSGECPKP